MIHTHRERKRERTRETLTNTAIFTTRVFFLNKWESFECEKREFRNNFFVNQIFSRRRSLNTLKLSLLLCKIFDQSLASQKKNIHQVRAQTPLCLSLTYFFRPLCSFLFHPRCLSLCLSLTTRTKKAASPFSLLLSLSRWFFFFPIAKK